MSQAAFTQRTILNYTLLRELGTGGQGDVFYAENEVGEPAAIKIIHAEYGHHTGLRERFQREASVMTRLNHPNICRAYQFYEDADQVAIVMEYLEGDDLQRLTDRFGPVQPAKAIEWYRQLLPAFQYAHEQGIIHRDVKPSNVLLTGNDQLKILDFSIAKALNPDEDQHRLTGTRTMLGTPLYMSPEQIQTPKSVDTRTDIYSLGVMLYTLLAGRAPFDAPNDSLFSLHQQIVNQPVPALPNLPDRLNQIIAKATTKNRDVRYGSCTELLRDLESVYPPVPPKIPVMSVTAPAGPVATRMTSLLALRVLTVAALPVGVYLTGRNVKLTGNTQQGARWQVGAFVTLVLVFSSSLLAGPGLGFLVYLGLAGFTLYTITKTQREALTEHRQRGGQFVSGWVLAGVYVAYYLLVFMLIGAGL